MKRITQFLLIAGLSAYLCASFGWAAQSGGVIGVGSKPWDQYVVHHWPDPVNVRSGNLVLFFEDIRVPFMGVSLDLARVYNSRSSNVGSFGYGWTASFDMRLKPLDSKKILIIEPDGSQTVYRLGPDKNTYVSGTKRSRIVYDSTESTYSRQLSCEHRHVFDKSGRLIEYSDEPGNSVRFYYEKGRLVLIGDTVGRKIILKYDDRGLVTSVRDPADRVFRYTYDDDKNLVKTITPGDITHIFSYDDSHNIVAIRYPDGGKTTITYHPGKDWVMSQKGPGRKRTSYEYKLINKQPYKQLSVVTDALGNRTEYVYEQIPTGMRLNTKDAMGGKTNKTYDPAGNLVSFTDAKGRRIVYTYDELSRLTSLVDAAGNRMSRTYSGSCGIKDLASVKDRNGNSVSYRSDPKTGMTFVLDALGKKVRLGFDDHGMLARRVDQLGHETKLKRDRFGNLSEIIDALGRTSTIKYDVLGRVVSTRGPKGLTTRLSYNSLGKMSQVTNPMGSEIKFRYDAAGRITGVTNAAGFEKHFIYNEEGYLIREIDEEGYAIRYERDANGNIVEAVGADGNRHKFQYDALNRLTKMIDPLGGETRLKYDAIGNIVASIIPGGHTTKRKYDERDQIIEIINTAGLSTQFGRDPEGNILEVVSPGERHSKTVYDKLYRPIRVTETTGDTWKFEWNGIDFLTKMTDPVGKITKFQYNSVGQVIKRTESGDRTRVFTYDEAGLLSKTVMEDGSIEQYSRNQAGQLTEMIIVQPGKTEPSLRISYEYDRRGNVKKMSDRATTLSFRYDARNNLIEVKDSTLDSTIRYGYDSNGMRTTLHHNGRLAFTYKYDALSRLIALTNEWGETYRFEYYPDGSRSKLAYPNGVTAKYRYDKRGYLTELTYKDASGAVLASYAYTYDDAGYIASSKEGDVKSRYTYDDKDRLVKVTSGNTPTAEFSYDRNGNIVRVVDSNKEVQNISYNKNNQLIKWGPESFTYDGRGRLIKLRDPKADATFMYNPLGLLAKIQLSNKRTVHFQYDPLQRRTMKRSFNGARYYIYSGMDLTWVLDEERKQMTTYTHGPGIDEPLAVRIAGKSYFLHSDAQGNIRLVTDSKAKTKEKLSYSPFGSTITNDTGKGGSYRYAGRIFDQETGLYYYRNRYYHPRVGRFTSSDPIGYASGQHNHYVYAHNNPVNYADPFGTQAVKSTGGWQEWAKDQATYYGGRAILESYAAYKKYGTPEKARDTIKSTATEMAKQAHVKVQQAIKWEREDLRPRLEKMKGSWSAEARVGNKGISGKLRSSNGGGWELKVEHTKYAVPEGLSVSAQGMLEIPHEGQNRNTGVGDWTFNKDKYRLDKDGIKRKVDYGPYGFTLNDQGEVEDVHIGYGKRIGPKSPVQRVLEKEEIVRKEIDPPFHETFGEGGIVPKAIGRIQEAQKEIAEAQKEREEYNMQKRLSPEDLEKWHMSRPDRWADPNCMK